MDSGDPMTPDDFAAILASADDPVPYASENARAATFIYAPLLLDLWRAADLLASMHEQMGEQFIPHDEIGLRAALAALEAAT